MGLMMWWGEDISILHWKSGTSLNYGEVSFDRSVRVSEFLLHVVLITNGGHITMGIPWNVLGVESQRIPLRSQS